MWLRSWKPKFRMQRAKLSCCRKLGLTWSTGRSRIKPKLCSRLKMYSCKRSLKTNLERRWTNFNKESQAYRSNWPRQTAICLRFRQKLTRSSASSQSLLKKKTCFWCASTLQRSWKILLKEPSFLKKRSVKFRSRLPMFKKRTQTLQKTPTSLRSKSWKLKRAS